MFFFTMYLFRIIQANIKFSKKLLFLLQKKNTKNTISISIKFNILNVFN